MIGTGAVTAGKIGTGAVTADKIGTGAVTETKIANDAVTQAKMANSSVGQSELKTSVSTVSTISTSGAYLTFTGGSYCHYPYFNCDHDFEAHLNPVDDTGGVDLTRIYLKMLYSVDTVYANTRYHTSSGEIFWIFILRDKLTKKAIAKSYAHDHVCFGNGGKPAIVQHPFCDAISDTDGLYLIRNGKKRRVEIVVLNPEKDIIDHCYNKTHSLDPMKNDKSFAQVFNEEMEYTTSNLKKVSWLENPVTVGLRDGLDWSHGITKPIKAVIPRPKHVLLGRTKLKN